MSDASGGRQDGDWQAPGGTAGARYGENPAPAFAPPTGPGVGAPIGGWTPPPKPGIVPLRPIAFGTLLLAPFLMVRRAPGVLVLSVLLQLGVLILGGGLVFGVVFASFGRIGFANAEDEPAILAGGVVASILAGLVYLALTFVVSALLQGFVVDAAARATLGERPTVRAVWGRVRHRIWPLIGWTLLVGAAVLVAVLLLAGIIVLGVSLGPIGIAISIGVVILLGLAMVAAYIWLYTKLSLVPSALVLERHTLRRSVARSWGLTNGFFWRTFGVQALVSVMLSVAINVVTAPFSLLPLLGVIIDPNQTGSGDGIAIGATILSTIVSILAGAVSAFVTSSAIALIYLDLRMRKEGLDLVLQRHVENGATGDPFAPGAT